MTTGGHDHVPDEGHGEGVANAEPEEQPSHPGNYADYALYCDSGCLVYTPPIPRVARAASKERCQLAARELANEVRSDCTPSHDP